MYTLNLDNIINYISKLGIKKGINSSDNLSLT